MVLLPGFFCPAVLSMPTVKGLYQTDTRTRLTVVKPGYRTSVLELEHMRL